MGDQTNLLSRKKAEENLCQEVDENRSEGMGTLKRLQRLVRAKKAAVNDDVKHVLLPQSSVPDAEEEEEEQTVTTCMKLTKSQDKKACKENVTKKQEMDNYLEPSSTSKIKSFNTNWSTSATMEIHSENSNLFTDWKSFPDNNFDPFVFTIKQIEEWERCNCCNHHSQLSSSLTDMDLPYSWRTSSFGAFERFKKPSVSKPEDLNETGETDSFCEGGAIEGDKTSNNAGSLTKKMKAISLTMRKKMGKKYIKALSEDMHDDSEEYDCHRDSDPGGGLPTEKDSLKASESVESLYSLNSGQSSSSGVTSCSDGTSNRDSFRLDEDIPYTGPFCGRARVHTDFTPSPYDTDSLKIKKGDVIDIIYKTPMGIWTGMLNNKVGNFKFIYVDLISEEGAPPKKTIARRKSKRPKPKTLQELMERLNMQDYISSLLLNGYETLEDLKDLKESHLQELNITSPEERTKLLVAIENLQDSENDQQLENESVPLTLSPGISASKCELIDCPRDSGCYISLENSESNRDEMDAEVLCDSVQKITITESA
ncbi:SAM domain-containing protein SAMSN-1 isoform 1-T2 [Rhinophrynus dorsalis]